MCINVVEGSEDSIVEMYDTSGGERFMSGPFRLRGIELVYGEEQSGLILMEGRFSGFGENIVRIFSKVKRDLKLF